MQGALERRRADAFVLLPGENVWAALLVKVRR
jgi:hypothetical protein